VSVESVKATGTVYAPASGEVTEVNTAVAKEPATINKSPLGEGWLVKMKLSDAQKELSTLLDEAAYKKHCEEEAHH
jgi:glycine cleavage system H protein